MDLPTGIPWDPRGMLPPGTQNPGFTGVKVAWSVMQSFFTNTLPNGWQELINAIRS